MQQAAELRVHSENHKQRQHVTSTQLREQQAGDHSASGGYTRNPQINRTSRGQR